MAELTALQKCRRSSKLNQPCLRQYRQAVALPMDANVTRYNDSQPGQSPENRSCHGNQLTGDATKTAEPFAPKRRKSHHRRVGDIAPLCRQ